VNLQIEKPLSPLLLLLASYGACFGLMNEKLPVLNRVLYRVPIMRDDDANIFSRMFKCSYCTGFHTGWVVWLASSLGSLQGGDTVITLLFAFASSASCYILDTSLQWLERP
tara:strand:+ start:1473 stop:1805 length:333 start_codon:yes stop_codon:yes gene_type:complete